MARKSKTASPFRYFNSSPEVIRLVVLMYVRFPLSLRNVEDLLFERGIDICHEPVRLWWNGFGPLFAADIRRQRISRMRGFRHWKWHLDEMYVKINGEMHYLWRAVDHEGEVLKSYVTKKRDKSAAIIALNLSAAFHTIRAAIAPMKAQGWGRITNVASVHGLIASPYKSAYVAAKHGVIGLTKTTALEAARSGVTCNAICPGYVWTPLVERQIDDTARARGIDREAVINDVLLAAQPSKRFTTVEELGGIAAFLCGPHAASITGTTIAVDGGWTAQ